VIHIVFSCALQNDDVLCAFFRYIEQLDPFYVKMER